MPDIQTLLEKHAGDVGGLIDELSVDTREGRNPAEYRAEYNGQRTRRMTSVGYREDKKYAVYSDTLFEADGKTPVRLEDKVARVARIVTNFPKKLVRTEAAMMFGGMMHVATPSPDEAFEAFRNAWERTLGMQDILLQFAETVLSETKAAIVFYPTIYDHFSGETVSEINCRILSLPENSRFYSAFYPHFFDGRMDAFLHRYQRKDDTGATRDEARIWTRDRILTATSGSAGWEVHEERNDFGLIPVVYAEVEAPSWEEVATLMDAREMRLSRLADTNDYFSEPLMVTYGLADFPRKADVGKEIQFPVKVDELTGKEYHGDAKFLSWDQSINSTEKELSETKAEMFAGVSAPDLSFDSLKGLGNLSGVARRFMMLDAEIKQRFNMRVFRPALNRCITVVQAGIANITNIKYKAQLVGARYTVTFDSILPRDPVEEANVLSIAGGGRAFNSLSTIVSRSPLTPPGDLEGELERLKEEAAEEAARTNLVGALAAE